MAAGSGGQIDTVMQETRLFPPPAEFAKRARIKSLDEYQELWDQAAADPPKFWAELARDELHWFKPFDKVLEWNEPFAKWFVGGKTNVSYNCLDRTSGRRAAATARPSSGKASRATRARSPMQSCTARSASSPTCSRSSASSRATSCRSTCRWCPSWPSPCWPARGSARSTR